jgi:adenosylcobinamide-phosphate guanylyltransferase
MQIPALIMAGGKGKRMGLPVEKPLLPLLGKPLIDWVTEAAQSAHNISDVYVVTSENTSETEKHCISKGLKVLRTDAKGYHDDLKQALAKANITSSVLLISSDLPALTGSFLDNVITRYEICGLEALTVLVLVEKRLSLGLSVSSTYPYQGEAYCVSGVNVLDAAKICQETLTEAAYISEELEAVLNVNTLEDLQIAEKTLKAKA